MGAGMFRVVKVSGKQQEVQCLLDQLIMPAFIDQGASVKADRSLGRVESKAVSKRDSRAPFPHEPVCHERTIALQSGEESCIVSNIKKIRNQ